MANLLTEVHRLVRRFARQDRQLALVAGRTLTLGLWISTLVFTLANGLLLRPLPCPDSSRLVSITASHPASGRLGRELSDQAAETAAGITSFDALARYQAESFNAVPDPPRADSEGRDSFRAT